MKRRRSKGWLYLLPAILLLGAFMVYPLIDVFIYSLEEGYNSASQTFGGVGLYKAPSDRPTRAETVKKWIDYYRGGNA